MTSSSSFSSISCDGSSASHSSLLTSKLWSVKLLHLENLTAKVAGKSGVTEVCCWTIDHKHRKLGLRLSCTLQWASSGSSHEQTSSVKVRCSGCKRLHVSSICLTCHFIFKRCAVFLLTLAGIGMDPALDDDVVCLQWSLFLCARSHLFWEEVAMTPYRVKKVNSGHKMGCSAWRRTLCLGSVSDSVACLLNYFGLISKISVLVSWGWKLWWSVLSFCSLGREMTM